MKMTDDKVLTKSDAGLKSFNKRQELYAKILNNCISLKEDPEDWEEDACNIWVHGNNGKGHGRVFWNGKLWYPHRLMWMMAHKGGIPKGYNIHHTCGNPGCCNINHMKLVPHHEHSKIHHRKRRLEAKKRAIEQQLESVLEVQDV